MVIVIAAQLFFPVYRLTQNMTYLNQSLLAFEYLNRQVLNHTTYLLADSILTYAVDCTPLPKFNVTYNSGMFIGGLVELYKGTSNITYIDLACKVANATIKENSPNGVLLEYCDWDNQCEQDDDAKMFKGVFVRNLRYLMDVLDDNDRKYYQSWLQSNIDSVLANAQCKDPIVNCSVMFLDGPSGRSTKGPLFTTSWAGPYNTSNVIAQTSVLDLFTSAIDPSSICMKGEAACDYNPVIPDIHPLSCTNNPCPPDHPCCTWDVIYATCCMPYQTCTDGGCYPDTQHMSATP